MRKPSASSFSGRISVIRNGEFVKLTELEQAVIDSLTRREQSKARRQEKEAISKVRKSKQPKVYREYDYRPKGKGV